MKNADINFMFIKKSKLCLILILFLTKFNSIKAYANKTQSLSQQINFSEKSNCNEMQNEFLNFLTNNYLDKKSLDEDINKCKNQSIISSLFKKKECLKDLERKQKILQDQTYIFINALQIKIIQYDINQLNLSKNYSPDCSFNMYNLDNFKFLDESKIDSIIKNCNFSGIKDFSEKEGSQFDKQIFEKRTTCLKIARNLIKINNVYLPEIFKNIVSEMKNDKVEPTSKENKNICDIKLTCEQLLNNPTNNPSTCYRDKLLDCLFSNTSQNNTFNPLHPNINQPNKIGTSQ